MRAVVIGGGLAGLLAARHYRELGLDPVVLEASDALGGMIRSVRVGGVTVDGGAEGYATRSAAARALAEDLGLPVAGPAGRPHVWWSDCITPMADGVLGIPGSLDDPALAVLSADELARLAQDVELGPEVGADAVTVGELVAARMGKAAVTKLVGPLAEGVYRMSPDRLQLSVFAPGLKRALAEQGSLLGAVASLREPGSSAVEQPVGGMFRLIEALADGLTVQTLTPALGLRREGGAFVVETPTGLLRAERVAVCVPAGAAARLLTGVGVDVPEVATHPVHVALLTSTHRGLGESPVGSGLLMGERDPEVSASALTHYSKKWPWVDGAEVLRLSYSQEPAPERLVADASRLTGLSLAGTVTDTLVVSHEVPGKLESGSRERLLSAAAAAGVDVLGAWLDGNGISPIIEAGGRIA